MSLHEPRPAWILQRIYLMKSHRQRQLVSNVFQFAHLLLGGYFEVGSLTNVPVRLLSIKRLALPMSPGPIAPYGCITVMDFSKQLADRVPSQNQGHLSANV